mgnify:CR=1 FL=1
MPSSSAWIFALVELWGQQFKDDHTNDSSGVIMACTIFPTLEFLISRCEQQFDVHQKSPKPSHSVILQQPVNCTIRQSKTHPRHTNERFLPKISFALRLLPGYYCSLASKLFAFLLSFCWKVFSGKRSVDLILGDLWPTIKNRLILCRVTSVFCTLQSLKVVLKISLNQLKSALISQKRLNSL